MITLRLLLIGFGNVGQGFARILADGMGAGLRLCGVCDMLKGSVADPQGLDPAALLRAAEAGQPLDSIEAPLNGLSALEMINQVPADALLEVSYTDLKTGEPAASHLSAALQRGLHAVTTNKGPIALHYPRLKALADRKGLELGVEGTVMSGTPVLRLGQELLAAAGLDRVQGIVNGTTNYMLSRMAEGLDYAAALAEAQQRGYAEANPSGDVEGFDAAAKVVILANLLLGGELRLADVQREGITRLTAADIAAAAREGQRWKLIACAERGPQGVRGWVRPQRLPASNPLYSVNGAANALTFSTRLLGDVSVSGPGAGRMETGYALLGDLRAIQRRLAGR